MRNDNAAVMFLVGASLVLGLAEPATAQIELTACGQDVDSADGILLNDLDCPASEAFGLVATTGRIFLDGHTITGATVGIACSACTIVGPGTITGAVEDGIRSNLTGAKVTIEGVTVTDNGDRGVTATRVRVRDSVVTNNGGEGLKGRSVHARGSTVMGNGDNGVDSRKAKISDSLISGNDVGIHAGVTRVVRSSVDANQRDGVFVNNGTDRVRFVAVDSTFVDNGHTGIAVDWRAKRIKTKRVVISGNGRSGIRAWPDVGSGCETRVQLDDATFANNDVDPACSITELCVDVDSCREPKTKAPVVCSTSHVGHSGMPGTNWGICSLD